MKRYIYLFMLAVVAMATACKADPDAINNTPEVFVDEAGDLLRTSAVLTGHIMVPGNTPIKEYGFLVSPTSDFSGAETQTIRCDEGFNEFATQVTGLEIDHSYFYAAYASNGRERILSTVRAFTTPTRSGVLLTDLRLEDEKRATLSARVSDTGGGKINAVGLCWAADKTPTTYDKTILTELNADNTFTASLTGLEAGKTYYVRAFADSDILGDGTTQTISYSRDVAEIRLEEELPEPEPEPIWMLSGSLQGGEDEIYFVEDSERGMFVAEDVNLTLRCRFKVCQVEDREVAYGYAAQTRTTHDMVDARLPLDLNGEDIEPTHAGVFDIWFDLDGKYLYIMSDDKTPEEADDYEPKPEEIIPAQPTILWRDYDISQQYRYEENMPIIIDIMAEGGINTLTVDIDSDVLTRDELLTVGLDSHIDLVNPDDMNDALISLGFLTGENIKGKTSLSIDLSNFCAIIPLISSGDNYANFTITVSDAYAQESDETLQLLFGTNEYVPETWKIYYTSTDGNIVEPYDTTVFGANIVSNTYENGQGVILFDGEVTEIGANAFYGCTTLKEIYIPNGVNSLGQWNPFRACSNLSSFYGKFASEDNRCLIIDGVLHCFAPAGLTAYSIPKNTLGIYENAFYDCSELTSITIPESVISLSDDNPFLRCEKLSSFFGKFASQDNRCLIVEKTIQSFAPAGLTNYTIPQEATKIGNNAFACCNKLEEITINDMITVIGGQAFIQCSSLKTISIPTSVQTIYSGAFASCWELTSVHCYPTTPPIASLHGFATTWDVFAYDADDRKIYVPNASVEAYKSAPGWSDYADSIYPMEDNSIWGLCGTFNGWGGSDNDIPMVEDIESNMHVAYNVSLAAGDLFKIRKNNEWNLTYGLVTSGYALVNDCTQLTQNGNENIIAPGGTYDIYFDQINSSLWLMQVGLKPTTR